MSECKLLQPSLSGRANACMIACASPASANADETAATLRAAATTARVRIAPSRATAADVVDDDPMAGDSDDADPLLRRRCLWLEAAGFGDVFARAVGDAADPLLLYVEGEAVVAS